MTQYVMNSDEKLREFIREAARMYREHPHVRGWLKSSKDRSLDQNSLSHVWYEKIARETGESTPEGIKSECKLLYGVPILRAHNPDFRAMYDGSIKKTLTYEQKISAMTFIPVTSLMEHEEMAQYMKDVQNVYALRGILLEAE